ncbi:MAG: BspA family leucine-rich repeat surface protein, partial [Alphaproteobacteria bacterium]
INYVPSPSPATNTVRIDTTAPTISSITIPANNYKLGDTIPITVNFSENITSSPDPSSIDIDVGGVPQTANFISKTANSMLFNYVVQAGDNDAVNGINVTTNPLNGAFTITDVVTSGSGNTLNPAFTNQNYPLVLVDGIIPTFDVSNTVPVNGAPAVSLGTSIVLDFSENVRGGNTKILYLKTGATTVETFTFNTMGTAGTGSNGGTLTVSNDKITIQPGNPLSPSTVYYIQATNGSILDAFGNAMLTSNLDDSTDYRFTSNNTSGVSALVFNAPTSTSGIYGDGYNIDITATFTNPVNITGLPRIPIALTSDTVYANYLSGSGTTSIIFRYTTGTGDNDLSGGIGIASNINLPTGSDTIKDFVGDDALLALPALANTIKIDNTAPAVASSSLNSSTGIYGISSTSADYIKVNVVFSEPVVVDTTGGNPTINLLIGATSKPATYASGSGTNTLLFQYPVVVGDNDSDGSIDLVSNSLAIPGSSSIKDVVAGGNANSALPSLNPTTNFASLLVDTTAPTITNITIPGGAYVTGNTINNIDITFSEPVSITGNPTLSFSIDSGTVTTNPLVPCVLQPGDLILRCSYTVLAGNIESTSPITFPATPITGTFSIADGVTIGTANALTNSYAGTVTGVTMNNTNSSFNTTWNTANTCGTCSANDSITIPASGGAYSISRVDGGEFDSVTIGPGCVLNGPKTQITGCTGTTTIKFPASGIYTIAMTGAFTRILFNNAGDKSKITAITQWGNIAWSSMERAFDGCDNLTVTATDTPNLLGYDTMSLASMFRGTTSLTGLGANGNLWNTSKVISMDEMFFGSTNFDANIGNWNTSKVINMGSMFKGASAFNQDISRKPGENDTKFDDVTDCSLSSASTSNDYWNTGCVTDMSYMFSNAIDFNQNIGNWDTSKVTDMSSMFSSFNTGISTFNNGNAPGVSGNLLNWNTSQVTDMSGMFHNASAFNQDISRKTGTDNKFDNVTDCNPLSAPPNNDYWNTGCVTTMSWMFRGATNFNQNIGSWDTSKVTDMSSMFYSISSISTFNNGNAPGVSGNLLNWNTSQVTTMQDMFRGAIAFNQDISRKAGPNGTFDNSVNSDDYWYTGSVTPTAYMASMFQSATKFNQNLSNWCVSSIASLPTDFDATTTAWTGSPATRPQWGFCPTITSIAAGGGVITYVAGKRIHTFKNARGVTLTATNITNNTIPFTGHTLANGDIVKFNANTMPGGLVAGSTYYVINSAANTFQVSTTSGGSAVDITSSGTAVQVSSTQNFTVTNGGNMEVLVIGGGGAGGSTSGAGTPVGSGGGAGGYQYNSSLNITSSQAITVGAGGVYGGAPSVGANGINSSIGSLITSLGGGGGGNSVVPVAGSSGGSGGGSVGDGGSGTVGQGNNGGSGVTSGAGGGGGASSVGSNGSSDVGGNGGSGTASSISGASVTYAGGGGGSGVTTAGSGGAGGGGNGRNSSGNGSAGTPNTGGGGGGSRTTTNKGGVGGSGIVIIRYPYP